MITYATRDEAVEREIVEVLNAGHGSTAAFDIDAIADEVLTTTGEGGYYRYVLAVDEDTYWAAVARHARTSAGDQ